MNCHTISPGEHTGESQYITQALETRAMARADVLWGQFSSGLTWVVRGRGDDRLLHLTASRSNNCKSHFRETHRVTDQCRQVVSRPLLILPRTGNSTFSWGLSCICLLNYITNFICVALYSAFKTINPGRYSIKLQMYAFLGGYFNTDPIL